MIDRVDQRLKDWVRTVVESADVSLALPADAVSGRGIGLYLMGLADTPPARGTQRPPLQIALHYLVTAWADTPEAAHRMLGDVVFAAMENSEYEVMLDPLPVAVWTALGVAPRPSFVLKVPLQKERAQKPAPLVRVALAVQTVGREPLQGVVVGPRDTPVMGARVELPAHGLSTRTNSSGQFLFSAVPVEPRSTAVRVQARGKEMNLSVELAAGSRAPLTIRFPGLEEA
jgi:Pvc16 N-terminal domain/Carboxypeptidase regulatory-like domain